MCLLQQKMFDNVHKYFVKGILTILINSEQNLISLRDLNRKTLVVFLIHKFNYTIFKFLSTLRHMLRI